MNPDDIVKVATGTTGVVAVLVFGIKVVGGWYRAEVAARMADKDAQIADLTAQRDKAVAALKEGNDGLELNADATDRLAKVVGKLVQGAKVKP